MSKGTYIKTGDYICIKDNTIGLDNDPDKQFISGMVSNIFGEYFMLKTSNLVLYKLSFASIGKRYSLVSINGKRVGKDALDLVRKSSESLKKWETELGIRHLYLDLPWELPKPKLVLANYKNGKDYVTVVWQDDTHTVICRNSEDEYDIDKAIMYATLKKMCGNNGNEMNRYLSSFQKCHKAHESK